MESTSQQHQHQANEILDLLNIHSTNTKTATTVKPKSITTEVRQLFIGNLPFRVRWQDIKDLFRKAGHVIRADVALNYENRSKGHGTVLFTCIEDAQKAIDMYNGYKWQGRILEVRGDRGFVDNSVPISRKSSQQTEDEHNNKKVTPPASPPLPPTPSAPAPAPVVVPVVEEEKETKQDKVQVEEEKIEQDDCKQLFVGNVKFVTKDTAGLPFHCQWQDLKDLFRNSGRILRADVVLNFEGRSRGFGTVLFSSHEDAKNAIEQYNGFQFHNRILRVHFDKFASSHQRFREHEANSFGQRQIHDPASIELLRQTYLPPPPQQIYGFSSSFMPDAYYNNNNNMGQQPYSSVAQQTHHHSPYMTQQLPFGMMNDNRITLNNFGYPQQHSPSFSTNNTTTTTNNTYTNMNNGMMFSGYAQQQQQQQWIQQSPLLQHAYHHQTDLSSLSNSFNNITLSNITNTTNESSSAGLNTKQDSHTWGHYTL